MRQKLIRLLRERSFVSARDAAVFLNMHWYDLCPRMNE